MASFPSSDNAVFELAAFIIKLYGDFSRSLGEKYARKFLKRVWSLCEVLNKRAIQDFYRSINSGEKLPF